MPCLPAFLIRKVDGARLGRGHKVTFATEEEPFVSEVTVVSEVAVEEEWGDDEEVMAMEQQLRDLRERKVCSGKLRVRA